MNLPISALCLLLVGSALLAGHPRRISKTDLIEAAPVIAVVEIQDAQTASNE